MIRIGLLGCGNVGKIIVQEHRDIEIVALFDVDFPAAEALSAECGAPAFKDFSEFIDSDMDIVVEAASVGAVREYAEEILGHKKDLIILSVGALSDRDFKERLSSVAEKNSKRIYIPSGAIIGLDNLKIGQITDMTRLVLRTTKSPASLGIETDRKMLIFKGTAHDCIRQYPKNINVAVALELATGHEAEVELWVDPEADRNTHEVIAEGPFGEIYLSVKNTPSPDNPATSYLAALSILTLLKNFKDPIVIGT